MVKISKEFFGKTKTGSDVEKYTMQNENNMSVSILTYGGALQAISVPDKDGRPTDVLLGHDTLADYEKQPFFFGALIGRCANRIGRGSFTLNGKTFQLFCNDGKNHLHGGKEGFDKKIWTASIEDNAIKLTYISGDGEENYPGELTAVVTYTLTDDNAIKIHYQASSTEDTLCNLTNHAYFNLGGYDRGSIENQQIQIFADAYTEADEESLPNGKILPVDDTPMDLRKLTTIGQHIDDDFDQLRYAGGFDHNWVLQDNTPALHPAAFACDKGTGITLQTETTLPGIQFYSGNYLNSTVPGKNQSTIVRRGAFCLETQYFPNAVHHQNFVQPVLKKGDSQQSETVYRFGLLK